MSKTYTVKLDGKDVTVTNDELSNFVQYLGLNQDLISRISELFLVDLFIYATEFGINPLMITEELDNLENGDGNTETKLATEFRRPPLQGLWHKHFFCQHFVAHNIINALGRNGTEDIIKAVMDESGNTHFTEENLSEIAKRITNNPITNRANNKALTGEWIVFAKHDGKNYYLCLNTHEAGDQNVADRIQANCISKFSFLTQIMV